jgi:hypothetical protein
MVTLYPIIGTNMEQKYPADDETEGVYTALPSGEPLSLRSRPHRRHATAPVASSFHPAPRPVTIDLRYGRGN